MAHGIDIELRYKRGAEDDKVEKVREGVKLIAAALGLEVTEQTFNYPNGGESLKRFTAG